MIIWLASYPRSGSFFFRILLYHGYGIRTHSIYPMAPDSKMVGMKVRPADIMAHAPMNMSLECMASISERHIVKTHELPAGDSYPAICLVRDGRDSLVSYARFILSFETDDNAPKDEQAFRNTLYNLIAYNQSFGGWGPNVSRWMQRERTAIIKFEDLLQNSLEELQRTLDAVGYYPPKRMTAAAPPTFAELHKLIPQFFRRGIIGAWRTEMPDDLHELFWQRHGSVMLELGYQR